MVNSMAEYAWVMKQWQRMCGSMQGGIAKCDNCPLLKVICQYKPDEMADFDEAEKIIADWAAKNPEPVYPTWVDWLVKQGVLVGDNTNPNIRYWYAMNMEKIEQPIPTEIAEKLGLEPKEVV